MQQSLRTLAAIGAIAGAWVVAAPALASVERVSCREYSQAGTVPGVVTPGGQPIPYAIKGELCATPAEQINGSTVQLLVHGSTYNHAYWDFGRIDGVRYSYARDVGAAGFATFAIDQIGAGQSSKPASDQVTNAVTAYVAHRAAQGLRDGSITGTRFGKIVEVGHSAGSASVWQEAITYQDVDGVIITGAVHHLSSLGTAEVAQDFYPASEDAKFDGSGLDAGYITTRPGTRGPFFYDTADPGAADPNVIAADDNATPYVQETFWRERGKDAIPSGQFDAFDLVPTTATQAIHVPVLVIMGAEDSIFCGPDAQGGSFDCSSGSAIVRQEAPFYASQAHLEGCSVAHSGHDISLHVNRLVQEAAAVLWSEHFVGQHGHFGLALLPAACG